MAYIRAWTVTEVTVATANPAAQVSYPLHDTDDIILLYLAQDGTSVPALPSGYTDIQNQAGAAQTYRLCYKVAASAAEVCPTLSGGSDEWHITVIAVAGADAADPINFSAERTATDNAAPFTWTSSASTDETNVLIFHFCNSDTGLALTARPPFVNLQNGDSGTAGGSVAYTFQPASGAITDCVWIGRANDDTTACAVGINDDGNGTRPAYAGPSTVGQYISALGGTSLIESDTNPASLTYGGIGMRAFTQFWAFDGTATYTDDTTDITDVGAADVTINNAVGAIWYFGYDYSFRSMLLDIGTASSGGTIVWEYYNGSTWTTLTMSGVLTAAGFVRFSWTKPSDWVSTSVNSVSKFYVRMRVSATFTTAPILDQGFVGGWPTTYDAIANVADAGVNPYNDVISLSPAATSNYSGSERQFGSAKDLDTGILVLHHKAVAARDYAVDPPINTETYPITDIGLGYGGYVVVLGDADGDYEAYSIHGKGALSASNNDFNVAAIGLNNGAQAYGVNQTLNKSAVTRMLFLPQGANGAMLSYVSSLAQVGEIVVAGGSSGVPINGVALRTLVNNCIGTNLLFNGIGTYNRVYAPMQIGGDHQTVVGVDGQTFAMPTKFDGKKYFDWNADDNVAGWEFYGTGANDTFAFTNCVWSGVQPYRWEFNSSHSGSTTLDFSGSKIEGATVTLRSTVTLDSVTFVLCPTFTLNAATITNCAFVNTKVSAAAPGDADNISDSTFTKTTGTQHGIEIGGTAADMTLDGVTFTGYAGSNGSTGNEAIYVNIGSGSMTINITGGGSTPSIRTAGATVTVQNAVTVKVTVKDVSTGAAIENARVLVEKVSDGTDILTGLTNASGIAQTTFAYVSDTAVTGKVRRASVAYGTLYKTSPVSATITATGMDITVLLIPDE